MVTIQLPSIDDFISELGRRSGGRILHNVVRFSPLSWCGNGQPCIRTHAIVLQFIAEETVFVCTVFLGSYAEFNGEPFGKQAQSIQDYIAGNEPQATTTLLQHINSAGYETAPGYIETGLNLQHINACEWDGWAWLYAYYRQIWQGEEKEEGKDE